MTPFPAEGFPSAVGAVASSSMSSDMERPFVPKAIRGVKVNRGPAQFVPRFGLGLARCLFDGNRKRRLHEFPLDRFSGGVGLQM
jgi:hypothetical protein